MGRAPACKNGLAQEYRAQSCWMVPSHTSSCTGYHNKKPLTIACGCQLPTDCYAGGRARCQAHREGVPHTGQLAYSGSEQQRQQRCRQQPQDKQRQEGAQEGWQAGRRLQRTTAQQQQQQQQP